MGFLRCHRGNNYCWNCSVIVELDSDAGSSASQAIAKPFDSLLASDLYGGLLLGFVQPLNKH
jgi:hypothetical protein